MCVDLLLQTLLYCTLDDAILLYSYFRRDINNNNLLPLCIIIFNM